MKCRYCGLEQDQSNIFCIQCGEAFYRVTLPQLISYESKGNFSVSFVLLNAGADPVAVVRVMGDGATLVKYASPNWPCSEPGKSKEFQFSYVRKAGPTVAVNLSFGILVGGNETKLLPEPGTIWLCSQPLLAIEDGGSITVSPIRGYEPLISVKLLNDSRCVIKEAHLFDKNQRLFTRSFGESQGFLTGKGALLDVRMKLPSAADGTPILGKKELEFQLEPAGLPAMLFPLEITYLDLPELRVTWRHWTDEGYTFGEVSDKDPVRWFVPRGRAFRKHLKLEAVSKNNVEHEENLEADLNLPDYLKLHGLNLNEKQRITDPSLSLSSEGLQIDQEATLSIKVTDKRLSQGFWERRVGLNLRVIEQETYPEYAALDFGTSNSCFALIPAVRGKIKGEWIVDYSAHDSLKPLPVERMPSVIGLGGEFTGLLMPSVLVKVPTGEFQFGRDATSTTDERYRDALNKYRDKSLKRDISNDHPLMELWGSTAQEGAAEVMGEMIRRASEYLVESGAVCSLPDKIVLSVPTRYPPAWREKLKTSCISGMKKAGIAEPQVKLVEESKASLRYYIECSGENLSPGVLVILDFGGGTTDLTAVRVVAPPGRSRAFEVLATGGNPMLGGLDVDMWIEEFLREKNLDVKKDTFYGWREVIKFSFGSSALSSALGGIFGGNLLEDKMAANSLGQELIQCVHQKLAAEFDKIFSDMIEQVISRLRKTGVTDRQTLRILLAGGASRLFGMKKVVGEACEKNVKNKGGGLLVFSPDDVDLIKEPKFSVCMGAFLQAGWDTGRLSEMTDIATFRILMFLPGGTVVDPSIETIRFGNQVFVKLVERGEKLPLKKEVRWEQLGLEEVVSRSLAIVRLYSQFGVETPEPIHTYSLVPPPNGNSVLEVTVNENGEVDAHWR